MKRAGLIVMLSLASLAALPPQQLNAADSRAQRAANCALLWDAPTDAWSQADKDQFSSRCGAWMKRREMQLWRAWSKCQDAGLPYKCRKEFDEYNSFVNKEQALFGV